MRIAFPFVIYHNHYPIALIVRSFITLFLVCHDRRAPVDEEYHSISGGGSRIIRTSIGEVKTNSAHKKHTMYLFKRMPLMLRVQLSGFLVLSLHISWRLHLLTCEIPVFLVLSHIQQILLITAHAIHENSEIFPYIWKVFLSVSLSKRPLSRSPPRMLIQAFSCRLWK